MVLTPRIAGTHLVPAGGGRYAASGAAYTNEYSSVNELNQTNGLIYDGESEFQYDRLSTQQDFERQREHQQFNRRQNVDHFGRLYEQSQERPINFSMLGNSSETFAAAFDEAKRGKVELGGAPHYRPSYTLDIIIDTYETNARVINNEIATRGEQVNIVL